jgi:hypothetical protein
MTAGILLVVHAAATWAMVGLVWFVQVVHYVLFPAIGPDRFARYETLHTRRTTLVVGPLMAVEAAAAVGLAILVGTAMAWIGLGLLAVVWASTAFLQVPCHGRLERGFDAATVRRLVATNWVRTAGWTARGLLAAAMLSRALQASGA